MNRFFFIIYLKKEIDVTMKMMMKLQLMKIWNYSLFDYHLKDMVEVDEDDVDEDDYEENVMVMLVQMLNNQMNV